MCPIFCGFFWKATPYETGIFNAHQRSCRKFIFSVVSVCHFVHWGNSPCDPYTWCIRAHCTEFFSPLALSPINRRHQIWDPTPDPSCTPLDMITFHRSIIHHTLCLLYMLWPWSTSPGHQTRACLPVIDIWWPSLETYSNLFTWGTAI